MVTVQPFVFALLVIICSSSSLAHVKTRLNIPLNSTWALLAWGNGRDSPDGMNVVDIDLFDQANLIPQLRAKGQIVICYFSAGSWEPNRPDSDNPLWNKVKIGKMDGWDENWLDIRQLSVLQKLMAARIDLAASQGCDGVEPDNTDCFTNEDCWGTMTNPSVRSGDAVRGAQISYNSWLSSYSHNSSLIIALKNTVDLIPKLVDSFDFAINEECQTYTECDTYKPFVRQNKAIFNIQYEDSNPDEICSTATKYHTQTKYCSGDGNSCSRKLTNCF